ncbi:ankyrin repeat domain-containing protein [Mariniblastus sp.]|nr:ankyrin repeat domain-containing protein [Mariniblastus sp.]
MAVKLRLRTFLVVIPVAGLLLGLLGLAIQRHLSSNLSGEFYDAIHDGDSEAVRAFIDEGINLDADLGVNRGCNGCSPLQLASSRRASSVVQILIESGADVDATVPSNRFPPLHWAIKGGSVDVVEMLLLARADPNYICDGGTSLDSLFGNRYPENQRDPPDKERLEQLLIEHGGIAKIGRSEKCNEPSSN